LIFRPEACNKTLGGSRAALHRGEGGEGKIRKEHLVRTKRGKSGEGIAVFLRRRSDAYFRKRAREGQGGSSGGKARIASLIWEKIKTKCLRLGHGTLGGGG